MTDRVRKWVSYKGQNDKKGGSRARTRTALGAEAKVDVSADPLDHSKTDYFLTADGWMERNAGKPNAIMD